MRSVHEHAHVLSKLPSFCRNAVFNPPCSDSAFIAQHVDTGLVVGGRPRGRAVGQTYRWTTSNLRVVCWRRWVAALAGDGGSSRRTMSNIVLLLAMIIKGCSHPTKQKIPANRSARRSTSGQFSKNSAHTRRGWDKSSVSRRVFQLRVTDVLAWNNSIIRDWTTASVMYGIAIFPDNTPSADWCLQVCLYGCPSSYNWVDRPNTEKCNETNRTPIGRTI